MSESLWLSSLLNGIQIRPKRMAVIIKTDCNDKNLLMEAVKKHLHYICCVSICLDNSGELSKHMVVVTLFFLKFFYYLTSTRVIPLLFHVW